MSHVCTIVSTRPELIRLSATIKQLDKVFGDKHLFVHTGQNFTSELNRDLYNDLELRRPDIEFNLKEKYTGVKFANYITEKINTLIQFVPKDTKFLILGDTNGALYASLAIAKAGRKIFHMEAGNRCHDLNVPEENNRKLIDSVSYKLLPYTQRSRENLLHEGYQPKDIIVCGNPIYEVVQKIIKPPIDIPFYYNPVIYELEIPRNNDVVMTFHRHENVTDEETLTAFVKQVNQIARERTVHLSVHPKLESMIEGKYTFSDNVNLNAPYGFKEFLQLEKYAYCVITDSGTVPEECAMFDTPCILIRDSTERPELLEENQMIVTTPKEFQKAYKAIEHLTFSGVPSDYYKDTKNIVTKLLLGDL